MDKILFRDFLVDFRRKRSLSQIDLAEKIREKTGLFLIQGTLSAWETGRQHPQRKYLGKVKEWLVGEGVDIDGILFFAEDSLKHLFTKKLREVEDPDILIEVFDSLKTAVSSLLNRTGTGSRADMEVGKRLDECLEILRLMNSDLTESSKEACLSSMIFSFGYETKKPPE